MKQKTNPNILKKFTGRDGKRNLRQALLAQHIVSGDTKLVRVILKNIKIRRLRTGQKLLSQDGDDDDVYFILRGAISIKVNGRLIATRCAGEHVGEMAILDPTALRSAAAVVQEPSIVAMISGEKFSEIAERHYSLWKRVATALAKRLRARSQFHRIPNEKPIVFIGSSAESVKAAQVVRRCLKKPEYQAQLWSKGVFEYSKTTIETLVQIASQSDFGIIILSPDDQTTSRRVSQAAPRDNLIYEIGLFMGAISRERTFILVPDKIKLKFPTNLLGLTVLKYHLRGPSEPAKSLKLIVKDLRLLMDKLGPK